MEEIYKCNVTFSVNNADNTRLIAARLASLIEEHIVREIDEDFYVSSTESEIRVYLEGSINKITKIIDLIGTSDEYQMTSARMTQIKGG